MCKAVLSVYVLGKGKLRRAELPSRDGQQRDFILSANQAFAPRQATFFEYIRIVVIDSNVCGRRSEHRESGGGELKLLSESG